MVPWKAGSVRGWFKYRSSVPLCDVLGEKGCPKGAFLKIPKIVKGTKNQLFIKKFGTGTLYKWSWGAVLNKHEKSMENRSDNQYLLMLQKVWKYKNTKNILFFGHSPKLWKNYTKGDLQSHVLWSKMATWASQVRLILWFLMFLGDAPKWWF